MRNLNEVEMNQISGGDGDMGPVAIPQGPTMQDLINAYNLTHSGHPLPPA